MTLLLTAFTGLLLGACTLCFFLIVLRYPKTPVSIGPYSWLGLIPHLVQKVLPIALSGWIRSARPSEQIRAFLGSEKTKGQAEKWLLEQVDSYLLVTVPQKWPMLSLLIGEKTHDKVRHAIADHLNENWGSMVQAICKQHASDEQVVSVVQSMISLTTTNDLTDQIWFAVRKKLIRLAPLFMFFSVTVAILGRQVFLILSSF